MSFRLLSVLVFMLAAPFAATPALAAPAQCPTSVDLRNLMTVTQYNRAGLDKLDKKELAALNAWLNRYIGQFCSRRTATASPPRNTPADATSAPAKAGSTPLPPPARQTSARKQSAPAAASAAQDASFGNPPEPHKHEPGQIESRIAGEFHGWTGSTIFQLENGQVWKQAGPGYFRVDLNNPKVVIKKLLIGYVLLLKGYGREVFVRRIR